MAFKLLPSHPMARARAIGMAFAVSVFALALSAEAQEDPAPKAEGTPDVASPAPVTAPASDPAAATPPSQDDPFYGQRRDAAASKPPPAPEEPTVKGFQVGARAGYVHALGDPSGNSFAYQAPSLLPIAIDVGYRTSTHVYLGLMGQLAIAGRTDCGGATDTCSAKEYRIGATFQYHFSPLRTFDPWFGAGFAYEFLHKSGFVGDSGGHLTRTGFLLLDAQIGGDIALGQGLRPPKIGPFVGIAIGSMGKETGRVFGKDIDRSPVADHQWAQIGVRGTYDL